MASPAQSALARSPVLWELTSPKSGRTLLGPLYGPSLRPSQGTWCRVTQGTQLVAPPMSFPPPYGKGWTHRAFIRLPHLKTFYSYGDFPQRVATCKYRGEYRPCPMHASSQHARTRAVFPPCDSRRVFPGAGLLTGTFRLHGCQTAGDAQQRGRRFGAQCRGRILGGGESEEERGPLL